MCQSIGGTDDFLRPGLFVERLLAQAAPLVRTLPVTPHEKMNGQTLKISQGETHLIEQNVFIAKSLTYTLQLFRHL